MGIHKLICKCKIPNILSDKIWEGKIGQLDVYNMIDTGKIPSSSPIWKLIDDGELSRSLIVTMTANLPLPIRKINRRGKIGWEVIYEMIENGKIDGEIVHNLIQNY